MRSSRLLARSLIVLTLLPAAGGLPSCAQAAPQQLGRGHRRVPQEPAGAADANDLRHQTILASALPQ